MRRVGNFIMPDDILPGDAGLDLDEEDEKALDRAWAKMQEQYAKNPQKFMRDFEEDEGNLPTVDFPD